METLSYPKLKHQLGRKWANIHSLSAECQEEFLFQSGNGRTLLRTHGRLDYRKLDGIYSFQRLTRGSSQSTDEGETRETVISSRMVFDGQHLYDEQTLPQQKVVYVHPRDANRVRVVTPSPMYFKFLERHGIVEACSRTELDAKPYFLIALAAVQKSGRQPSESGPVLEVFYHDVETGLLMLERYFTAARQEMGRCVYGNMRLNEDTAAEPFDYVKPPDAIACPLEEEVDGD